MSADPAPETESSGLARFAHGRFGTPMLCFLSFTDACISPIIPEVVLVPLVLGRPEKRWRYAFLVSAASVIGGAFGYLLGMFAWTSGLDRLFFEYVPGFTQERFDSVSQGFGDQTFWVMFAAGFTPLPYKVFTVVAGAFHDSVAFPTFLLASALSRFLRFYLTVWLLHQFGRRVLEQVSRNMFRVLVCLLLIAVVVLMWVEL